MVFSSTSLHIEKEVTSHARGMIAFLMLKPDDDLLSAIEEAIQSKARTSGLPIDLAANQIHIAAMLTKIRKEPNDWPTWFRSREYQKQG